MKETKFSDPPSVEEFEAAIVESVDPGIRDDCRRIEEWIAENSASWPPEIQRKAESIPLITAHIRKMFAEGRPDKLIHSRLTALWTAVKAVNRELDKPYVETGRKIRDRPNRGGRTAGATIGRDVELAREFQCRRPQSARSDTALKADIGKKWNLGRSAAIEAINRGLKKLSG